MPNIEAKEINGGHDFKTSLLAGFERGSGKVQKLNLCFLLHTFLQTCIQMDVDTDDHSKEGIVLSGMYAHIMQVVIIKNPIIYPFTCSTVIVYILIFIRTSGNRSIEPDVPVRFCVNTTTIRRCRAFLFAGTGRRFAAGKRAAPFAGMFLFTVPPVDHAEPGHAQWCSISVNGYGVRDGTRAPPVRVEVNKRADVPFLTKLIGGIVVMCRVQAEVPDRDIRINGFKFP